MLRSKYLFRGYTAFSVLFLIAVLVLISTGCASRTVVTPDPSASQATQVPKQTPPPVNNFLKQFGGTITWDDGISISVSEPTPYVPSDTAAGMVDGYYNIIFEFVLTNNSDKPYDPAIWPSVSSGNVEASMIADVASEYGSIGFPPSTVVLPGQYIKWYAAYSVLAVDSITLQVTPNLFSDYGVFTNIPF